MGAGLLLIVVACAGTRWQAPPKPGVSQRGQSPLRDPHRTGIWTQGRIRQLSTTADCPAVQAGQLYRFIAGADSCLTPMSSDNIAKLNDPWAVNVLRKNAGGQGLWPSSVTDIVDAVQKSSPGYIQASYMVGEGSQIPASVTPVSSNRNLRYLVTWEDSSGPVIFLSARVPGTQGGTPPAFLQVISFDPVKQLFNYYQYVGNADVNAPASDGTQTWTWAGDSNWAYAPQTATQGCFQCHLNGGLNMKERTAPWNNWNSSAATILPNNLPSEVRQDPLYRNGKSAAQFETVFESQMFNLTSNWIKANVRNKNVSNIPALLRRLTQNTTINFASSQVQNLGNSPINGLPNDLFLFHSVLRDVLELNYTLPNVSLERSTYNAFLKNNQVQLVNTDRDPDYSQPGATFFSAFVPVPAYEDVKAIEQLLDQGVISQKFATAVLMVDFPNPVFSPTRASLQQYAAQLSSGKANSEDIPSRFANLVTRAAASQPPCDPAAVTQCTAEQQFLFYWRDPQWKQTAEKQITQYLAAVQQQTATPAGQNDVMKLIISRGVQFQNYWPICSLDEFSLLLPKTSLDQVFVQMTPQATLVNQAAYSCQPPPS